MNRFTPGLLLALCLGLSAYTAFAQPNIVVIFTDEMSPEYLGCYGGKYETPNINRLAAEGMRFEQAFTAASACTPSRYSVLTGQYPGRAPVMETSFPLDQPYSVSWNTYIDADCATIPRILSQAGYATGMFGKNHVTSELDLEALNLPAPPGNDLTDPAVDAWLALYQGAIGLAIVKLVIEKLGGTVELESEVGEGSTFTLTLPKESLS